MKEIHGDAKNIRSLLSGSKFALDYYQREYRWEKKQIAELLDDLRGKFLEDYQDDDDPDAVINYGRYFLGSIIISDKGSKKFIIDGQQRITSLTLLLIHIHRQLDDGPQKQTIGSLIVSYQRGKHSFNLEVDERNACMNALFKKKNFDGSGEPESVVNILKRYEEVEEYFLNNLIDKTLRSFADWLIENVYLIEITAYSDADAYTIFETMNDRGLSLTPTDMLKGYLLANITNADYRNSASKTWRKRIAALQNIGKQKNTEDADAIKGWLRSQYAQKIREHKPGATPHDFDLIGTEFHRWVRDNKELLNLKVSADFGRFIEEDFVFYSRRYAEIREAAKNLTEGLEAIHYNAQNNFTLQYPVLLASLVKSDEKDAVKRKLRIVASYLEILIARRIWNSKSIAYNTMDYAMFQLVILEIRRKPADELADFLTQRLNDDKETTFASNAQFQLHNRNGRQVHRLLARMTAFVETAPNCQSRYAEYIKRGGKDGYEVEHIWADVYDDHEDEFSHPADFAAHRNRIGGLLLLPKAFNRSFGKKPYAEKREHYFGQNLLAQSLHENAYKNNPGFRKFRESTGLAFRAHAEFKKADLDARQELYLALAEQIWNPEKLLEM